MADVFISYLREDQAAVEQLARDLRRHDLTVWLDRDGIAAGEKWQAAIENAIEHGGFFLACFSERYSQRERTFMTEELTFAAGLLQEGGRDRAWFVPVRLEPCEIPEIPIPGSGSIRSIQWVDLFPDREKGLHALLRTVRPPTRAKTEMERKFRELCSQHIENKIARNEAAGARLLPLVQARWRALLDPQPWTATTELMIAAAQKKTPGQSIITEHTLPPGTGGCSIAVTLSTTHNPGLIIGALPKAHGSEPPYVRFILRERQRQRIRPDWDTLDFAHWVISQDEEGVQVDLLYIPSARTTMLLIGMQMRMRDQGEVAGPLPQLHPGSLMSTADMDALFERSTRVELELLAAEQSGRK